jgi:hypothetical protein
MNSNAALATEKISGGSASFTTSILPVDTNPITANHSCLPFLRNEDPPMHAAAACVAPLVHFEGAGVTSDDEPKIMVLNTKLFNTPCVALIAIGLGRIIRKTAKGIRHVIEAVGRILGSRDWTECMESIEIKEIA